MILGAAYPLWPHNRVVFGNSKPKFLHKFSDLNRREVLTFLPSIPGEATVKPPSKCIAKQCNHNIVGARDETEATYLNREHSLLRKERARPLSALTFRPCLQRTVEWVTHECEVGRANDSNALGQVIEQSIISQRYLHHNMDSKHLWQGTGSFQLRYGADAKSTTGFSARTDTTSSESYVSNVSIRVFGSTGELDNRGFGNLGRGTRSISLDPAKAKHLTVRPWADC